MIKVSKHQKRNVLANTRRLVKDVTLVSEMVKLENISKEEANIKLEKTARSIMRKDGLQTALLALSYFRAMLDKNAPDGTLNGTTLIYTGLEDYFSKFDQSNIPKIEIHSEVKKPEYPLRMKQGQYDIRRSTN